MNLILENRPVVNGYLRRRSCRPENSRQPRDGVAGRGAGAGLNTSGFGLSGIVKGGG